MIAALLLSFECNIEEFDRDKIKRLCVILVFLFLCVDCIIPFFGVCFLFFSNVIGCLAKPQKRLKPNIIVTKVTHLVSKKTRRMKKLISVG